MADLEGTRGEKEKADTDLAFLKVFVPILCIIRWFVVFILEAHVSHHKQSGCQYTRDIVITSLAFAVLSECLLVYS